MKEVIPSLIAQLVEYCKTCLVPKDALSAINLLRQALNPRQEYSLENIEGSNPFCNSGGVLNLLL